MYLSEELPVITSTFKKKNGGAEGETVDFISVHEITNSCVARLLHGGISAF